MARRLKHWNPQVQHVKRLIVYEVFFVSQPEESLKWRFPEMGGAPSFHPFFAIFPEHVGGTPISGRAPEHDTSRAGFWVCIAIGQSLMEQAQYFFR